MSTNKFEIDLNRFAGYVRYDTSADITALRIILDSIERGEYDRLSGYPLSQGMMKTDIPVPKSDFVKQREIHKCFKAIMSSVQNYMDTLLAAHELTKKTIKPPSNCTVSQAEELLQNRFSELLMKVSTDRSLSVPRKLSTLIPDHEVHRSSLQSLFDIRNGLEHHKAIANKEKSLKYLRVGLCDSMGTELSFPFSLTAGEGLAIKAFEESIEYNQGGYLFLTREQLENIILNISTFSIEALLDGARALMRKKDVS